MTGWEVARRIRADGRRTPRIVIVSANTALGPAFCVEVDLHNAVLPKPVDLRRLLATLDDLLGIAWTLGGAEPPVVAAPPPPLAALPAQAIEELLALGRIGHARGIEARLDDLDQAGAAPAPGLARLRDLVRRFDLPGFVAALEAMPR